MIRLAALVLGAALATGGCAVPEGPVDLEVVRSFFGDLGEQRITIDPRDRLLDEKERHVFRWIVAAISASKHGDYEILELSLSRTTVDSRYSYELTRHRSQGLGELISGRPYVQLHAVHRASDPELHGVIDGTVPRLLSFWAEGA